MLPLLIAAAGLGIPSAQGQTPLDGSLPQATGVSYVAAPAQDMAQTQIQVQTQTEPDIDGTLATEVEAKITGALPLSPAEKARSVKARDLSLIHI